MNREEMMKLPVPELLEKTQTNVTPDAAEGFAIAQTAFERSETPIEAGVAARQAGFRAEQAGEPSDVVQLWFENSRAALSSDDPQTRRELIATELLTGRALALRIERMGSKVVELTAASAAFERGEATLQEQHARGSRWDRFGTMLARHRATHEAMNGRASLALTTAGRGLWRALRAQREGKPKEHGAFVAKQFTANAIAGALAASKPFAVIPKISAARHKLARKLLG